MLRISCPWCGLRDQAEFRSGGEASVVRPANPQAVSDDEWADYLFYRNNIKGAHRERWLHSYGCRQWFVVTRDTVTHEITETQPINSSMHSPTGNAA
ncbi:MAG TPA: sarcosine oxidase subunit delta [Xanthomonadales bacterium]|nr:sarcosine oxidase subunit delta [Xanthomonadales bacterium]